MNKQEKIKQRTWEYFWKQKVEEIFLFILIILFIGLIIFILCIVPKLIIGKESILCSDNFDSIAECSYPIYFALSLIFIGTSIVIGLGVYVIFKSIKIWIESNWEKAEERAREDFK